MAGTWKEKTLIWLVSGMFVVSGGLISIVYANMKDTVEKKATKEELRTVERSFDEKTEAQEKHLEVIEQDLKTLIRMHLNLSPSEKQELLRRYGGGR